MHDVLVCPPIPSETTSKGLVTYKKGQKKKGFDLSKGFTNFTFLNAKNNEEM